MRRYQPDLRPRAKLSLLDVNIGSLIEIIDSEKATELRFVVVGMSLSQYAFVSAFNKDTFGGFLKKYNLPCHDITIIEANGNKASLTADCSKMFVRRFGDLSNWLEKHPESYLGNIKIEDTDAILALIKSAETISSRMKEEFNFTDN
jgi:hypothetical protein